jgi:hypothetical protein
MSARSILTGTRALIGGGAWLAPRLSGRLFGLDVAGNPQLPYVARLFAIRDVALAAGLQASDGDALRFWVQAGIACDAADAAAGILAGRRGELSPLATALVTATALTAVGLGISVLRESESSAPAAS